MTRAAPGRYAGRVSAPNIDSRTVEGFGEEWARFDQSGVPTELDLVFEDYFAIFPWDRLPPKAEGFDLGCGSGRWAARVAPRVGRLHCIDPSAQALAVANRLLSGVASVIAKVDFMEAAVDAIPLQDGSQDFGYSLGVLHHVPDTSAGIAACVRKLKPGAPFLVYLYYAFDNRGPIFRALWKASDVARRGICQLPFVLKKRVTDLIALTVYLPLALTARVLEIVGANPDGVPLAYYRDKSFYTMRTDALDRFGTRLEQRFTRAQIKRMLTSAGLKDVKFSEKAPYWCAVGVRG